MPRSEFNTQKRRIKELLTDLEAAHPRLIEDIRAEFSVLIELGGVVNEGFIQSLVDQVVELVKELAREQDAELLGENYAVIVALAFLSLNANNLTPN